MTMTFEPMLQAPQQRLTTSGAPLEARSVAPLTLL